LEQGGLYEGHNAFARNGTHPSMDFRWTVAMAARHYRHVSFVLALLACWLGGTPSWAATIDRVEIRHDRIIIRFDQSVADASSFVLAAPQRIAVDVGGAFSLSRRVALTGGVRYEVDRDKLNALKDERRDGQAVYVGTAFKF